MSSRLKQLPDPKRSGLLGAALSVFLGIFFYFPTWHGLYLLSYDLPLKWSFNTPPKNAVIIYMDEQSRQKLGQPLEKEWDRQLHAELIRQLQKEEVKAIAFDVLFDQTNNSPKIDADLAKAIADHGRVVLAANLVFEKHETSQDQSHAPFCEFPTHALESFPKGIVNFESESDGKVRKHWYNYWSKRYPFTFASEVAKAAGISVPEQTRIRWINYYDRPYSISNLPFFEALSNNVPVNFYKDKTVFVGRRPVVTTKGASEDAHPTPSGMMPGVEMQATVFLNLANKDWLTELPLWLLSSLFLFVGGAAGYGFVYLRPWVAARWAAGAILVTAFLGFLLPATKFHYWFPWLIIIVVQIPAALVWAVIVNSRRLYAEKSLLEETLATARSAVVPAPQAPGFNPPSQMPAAVASSASDPDAPTLQNAAPSGPAIPDMALIRNIGQGAYGEVWLGRDILGTYKAVKIVFRDRFSSPAPFDREFRGLQKFTPISRTHVGFVHILHVGRNDPAGYFYAIMEIGDDERTGQQIDPQSYTPRNLSKELRRRGKLPVNECLELSVSLANALDYLHKQRLIHRDIKPSNIIFVNGQPKFADIGLVTDLAERGGDVTYLGTEGFIAPEGPGTAAADVYALGKVMYEASMGRDREFFPELPTTLVDRPDRRELLQLNDIIIKACEVEVDQRYQTANELKTDLLALQTRLAQSK